MVTRTLARLVKLVSSGTKKKSQMYSIYYSDQQTPDECWREQQPKSNKYIYIHKQMETIQKCMVTLTHCKICHLFAPT